MTDITKLVDRAIPPTERTQSFTESDASAGDVLLVKESLGRPARRVNIESDGGMSVRFNVYHTIFPEREGNDLMHTKGMPNLSQGQTIKLATAARVTLGVGEIWEMDGDFPTSDIELVTASGNWEIIVS